MRGGDKVHALLGQHVQAGERGEHKEGVGEYTKRGVYKKKLTLQAKWSGRLEEQGIQIEMV